MKKSIYTIAIFCLICSVVFAASIINKTETVEIGDAEKIILKGELGAGNFRILPEDNKEAFIAEISYNKKRDDYWVESNIRSNVCYIEMGSEHTKSTSFDTEDNKWDITLSKKYPIEIDFEIGACQADFEFGGIPIEELKLDIGATDAEIDFSEVNPIRLKDIKINAGASSFKMNNIGNANFDTFDIDGGAGSFDLDFLGEYKGISTIKIELGLGSADVTLPRNIPVQIHADEDSWLSSIDIHNNRLNQIDDDLYESDGFDDAETKIIIYVSVGLGSVDIRFRK